VGKIEHQEHQVELFPGVLSIPSRPRPKMRRPRHPLWTANKARLIERYLHYFVFITKHGTYIDGFAGPQKLDKEDMWAAKLVLANEPRWLQHFYLYELKGESFARLEALKASQPPRNMQRREPRRDIHLYHGDFNVLVLDLLNSGRITEKEATFCLLDQRTFECSWATLKALAQCKTSGNKIELFYLLPNFWLHRALKGQKDTQLLERWWGRPDWHQLAGMRALERANTFAQRFQEELGYWSALPWPIYQHAHGGAIMYFMIHATDHPDAPGLMARAYENAVLPKESEEQLVLELGMR
jgi:three-Cys-motif partner protein